MRSPLTVRGHVALAGTAFLLVLAGLFALAHADDSDLQQYNRPAANAEAANAAGALTGPVYLVRDGKKVTADSNAAGSAPINRSVKQLADALAGLRCATQGGCSGVNQRTVKSLQVDGSGGAPATVPDGALSLSGSATGTSLPTPMVARGVVYREALSQCWAVAYYNGTAMVLVRGYNIASVTRNGAGNYTVNCNNTLVSPSTAFAVASVGQHPTVATHGYVANVVSTYSNFGVTAVQVYTIDVTAGAFLDATNTSPFYVDVKGY